MGRPVSRRLLKRVHAAIATHHRFVYRFAYRIVRNQADAEDVAQSVFLKLLHSPEALARVSTLRAWLAQVTWNAAVSFLRSEERRKRRERTWVARKKEHTGDDDMMENDSIHEAISGLPDDLRVPVILYYQEGLKYREIAQVCGCPEGTVAQRLSRAKARLKEKLGAGGALSAFPSIEAALRSEAPIPYPSGLEQSILHGVNAEFAQLAGVSTAVSAAGGGTAAASALAFKLGAAVLISTALVTSAFVVAHRVTNQDELSTPTSSPSSAPVGASVRPAEFSGGVVADSSRSNGAPAAAPTPDADASSEEEGEIASQVDGSTVFGWVRDANGQPVAGAKVSITGENPNLALMTTTTDSEGHYEFEGVNDRGIRNHFAKVYWDYSAAAEAQSVALRSLNVAADEMVQSVAFSADGQLLATSPVVVSDASESSDFVVDVAVAEAAAQERAAAQAAAARDRAMAEAAKARELAAAAQERAEALDAARETELMLAEELRARDDLKVAQEQLSQYKLHADLATMEFQNTRLWTGGSGTMRGWNVSTGESLTSLGLVNLQNGAFAAVGTQRLVVVELDGYETAISDPFKLEDGETLHMDVELQKAKVLGGAVLSESGEPIAGASVVVAAHTAAQLFPDSVCRVETDEEGRFEFTSLFQGTFVLRADAAGFLPSEVVAFSGRSVELRLTPAASLTARVTRGGTGEVLSGILVQVRDGAHVVAEEVTGEDGVAKLTGLPSGDYLVNAYRLGSKSTYSRAQADVRLLAGAESEVGLVVERKVKVKGVILAAGEKIPPGLKVVVVPLDGLEYPPDRMKSGSVEEDGTFAISSSMAPGPYVLGVLNPRFKNGRDLLISTEIEPTPGSEDDYELQLGPAEPAGLDVTVFGADGMPLPKARVQLRRADFGTDLGTKTTDETGRVSFEALPGVFALHVYPAKGQGKLGTEIVRDLALDPYERRPIEVSLEARELVPSTDEAFAAYLPPDTTVAIQNAVRLDSLLELLERSGMRRFGVAPDAAAALERSRREGTSVTSAAKALRAALEGAGLALEGAGGRLWIVEK